MDRKRLDSKALRIFFGVWILGRLVLAAWVPLTGDEAYYIQWGLKPELSYLDQPPLIGWIHAALNSFWRIFSSHPAPALWFRLLPVLLWPAVVWNFAKTFKNPRVALVLATQPFLGLFPLAIPDVYLGATLLGALTFPSLGLSLAVLTKPFALPVLATAAAFRKSKWTQLIAPIATLSIFFALDLATCSKWIGFTFFNRFTTPEGTALSRILETCVYVLIHGGPALVLGLALLLSPKRKLPWAPKVVGFSALATLGLFLLSSISQGQGLHWSAPFALALSALGIWLAKPGRELKTWFTAQLAWNLMLSLAVLGVSARIAYKPDAVLNPSQLRHYEYGELAVSVTRERSDLGKELMAPGAVPLVADGYGTAAIASVILGRSIPTFTNHSRFGRQDDFWTDWNAYDGKSLRILTHSEVDAAGGYAGQFFESVHVRRIRMDQTVMTLIEGSGFRAKKYWDTFYWNVLQRFDHLKCAATQGVH